MITEEIASKNLQVRAEEYFESLCISQAAGHYPRKGYIAGVKSEQERIIKILTQRYERHAVNTSDITVVDYMANECREIINLIKSLK